MKIASGKIYISLIFTLFTLNVVFGQSGNWVQKADFGGTERQYAVGFSIGNKGYIGTGWDLGIGYRDDFWEYDPATNSWTQRAPFAGGARILAVGFSIGNRGYIGTGQDFIGRLNDFWEYNPFLDLWTKKANFGGPPRTRATGFSIGTKGYIGTGYEDATNTYFDDFWEYDPLSNTWAVKANVGGGGRREAVGFSIGNKGYLGTGYDGLIYLKDFWQYDPYLDSWTQNASVGTAQWLAVGFSIGNKGYLGIGYGLTSPLKEFWEYDTLTNKWTRNKDFGGSERFGAVGFSIGLRGYVGTGFDINSLKMKDFWEFQPVYIYTGALAISRLCVSSTKSTPISVPYTISIKFNPGNVFTAQLSDSGGKFTTPTNIGSRIDTISGIINANIPPNMIPGLKYRIRVVSSNPAFLGSDNGKDLSINPNPNVGLIINDTSQCLFGNSFVFEDTSTISSGMDTLTQWFFGDGVITSGSLVNHTYANEGNFNFKMRVVSDSGCADSVVRIIYVLPTPKVSFNASDTVQCLGSSPLTFTNTSTIASGSITYEWHTGNGDTFTTTDLIYTYSTYGTYRLSLIAASDQGCIDSAFKQIKIDSTAGVDFTISDTIACVGNPINFTNTTSGNLTFVWNFGDGSTFNGKDATHTYSYDSTYDVKLAGYSAQCNDSIVKKVYIKPKPVAGYTVNQKTQNLVGNNFIFTNTSTIKSGTFTSFWDFDDGNTSIQNNPSHTYAAVNTYLVMLKVTSDFGCFDSIIDEMTVINSTFKPDFTVLNLCYGDSTLFVNTSTIQGDSFLNFLWFFGDGTMTIIRSNPRHLYKDTGDYLVTMIALTALGLKDSVTYMIHIEPAPSLTVTASPSPPYYDGDIVTLTANGSFDSIFWSTGSILSTTDVDSSGTYWVRVVNSYGCDTTGYITVEFLKVEDKFDPPNTMTPNGDGYNDFWVIDNIQRFQPCKVAIYNRWGDELYSSSNYQNNWDGKYKGKNLPEGSYYYVFEANNGKVYKGVLNIIQ
jgi:gliding motility-associated-like protein